MSTSNPLLLLRGLRVGYGGRPLLPAVDVDVDPGELWALLGRNGSGKSTLLRTLIGLLPPVEGEVVPSPDVVIGYVPQRSELDLSVPSRVKDVVRTGSDTGWSFLRPFDRAANDAVERAMADMRVDTLANRPFAELSEGQKQRVLVARALVAQPSLLVLDEPTSAMDKKNERAVLQLLEDLVVNRRLALVVVTHHLAWAAEAATHLVYADKDEGTAIAGVAQTVLTAPVFVRDFGTFVEGASGPGRARNKDADRGALDE
jgi:zinc transport system ATP-binding protein